MTQPWYREYFGLEFFEFAERVRTAESVCQEASYLQEVIAEYAPGRTVIEVGCGLGARAVRLAQAGFDVIGLDPSERVIEEARRRCVEAKVDMRWWKVDLWKDESWPTVRAHAAICGHWFGCGHDSDQRRLLRTVRRHLKPHGLLILEGTPFWLTREFYRREGVVLGCTKYQLESEYDVATSRSEGSLSVSSGAQPVHTLPHSMRIYSPVELCALAKEAGFAVTRVNADWNADARPIVTSDTIQLIGHSLPVPPASLAVTSWATPPGVGLDLRYANDEAELLHPRPDEVWREFISSSTDCGCEHASHYAVDDPFGGERGSSVVAAHFGISIAALQLTFGAGVTSLIHDLAGLADGGLIAAPELVHGDLEAWAVLRGAEVQIVPEPNCVNEVLEAIEAFRPALLHLDRPTFAGQFFSLNQIETIARAASRLGTVVLIDESAAPYVGPQSSSACVVPKVDNLLVLRGFTKAYSLCGLRAAYCLASAAIAERVRELVTPLQVSETSFQVILRLLAAGDIFGALRARIHVAKPKMIGLLEAAGLDVIQGNRNLPWVIVRDVAGETFRLLERRGITALRPAAPPVCPPREIELLRLTVPLSEKRMASLEELLTSNVGMKAY